MLTSLEIKNFRGLRQVKLTDLKRLNLIVGGNDTGKTSILEALVLLLGDGSAVRNLPITFRTNQSGGQSPDDHNDRENFWSWLFYDHNPDPGLKIVALTDTAKDVQVHSVRHQDVSRPNAPLTLALQRKASPNVADTLITFPDEHRIMFGGNTSPAGFRVAVLSTRPANPVQDAENYNQVALLADGEKRIEQIMREVEPRVRRLRYAKLPRTTSPLVFVDIGLSRAVPATQMGQAFNRILHIYTYILANRANILLIDEIENGIFSDAMATIWRGLLALCEQEGVQIFATTHSRECVMAAHEAEKERGKEELTVQRMQMVKGEIEAVRLGSPHLDVAAEMGLEVRS